jgi:hypothetical protein
MMERSGTRKLFLYLQDFLPWLTGGFVVLCANWAASAFYETFDVWRKGQLGDPAYSRMAYVALFFLSIFFLYRQKNSIIRPHTRMITPRRKLKMKHLIFFVSPVSRERFKTAGIPVGLHLTNDITRDINMIDRIKREESQDKSKDKSKDKSAAKILSPAWQWEMILRGMEAHWEEIETISFICSDQSLPQVHLLFSLCRKYYHQKEIAFFLLAVKDNRNDVLSLTSDPVRTHQGINFEDFDDLSESLEYLIKYLKKRGAVECDMAVDITGGQKPCSAVGASMSFNRDIKAQYVQTGDPWKVLSYDVVHVTSDTGGLGL